MSRHPELYPWQEQLAAAFPNLSPVFVVLIALWSLGMILAHGCGLSRVACFLARLLGQRLEAALKYPVIVESRPGAGGSVGVGSVARAPADGHTMVMGHIGTLAVNPAIYQKLTYDPLTSFEPVSGIASAWPR